MILRVQIVALVLALGSLEPQTPPASGKEVIGKTGKEVNGKTSQPETALADSKPVSSGEERRQRAIQLIKDAGIEAAQIDNVPERARIQASAAKALCAVDRDSANALFRTAFSSALDYYKSGGNNFRTEKSAKSESGYKLNIEIMATAGSCDPVLREEFSESLSKQNASPKGFSSPLLDDSYMFRGPGGGSSSEANALSRAGAKLKTDQAGAILEAKAVLARHMVTSLTERFLWQLAQQDRFEADQMFLWLLDLIQNDPSGGAGRLQMIANYAFGGELMMITDGLRQGWTGSSVSIDWIRNGRKLASEGWLRQRFIEASFVVLTRTATMDIGSFPDGQSRLGAAAQLARWLEPRVMRYQPLLVPLWQELMGRLHERLNETQQNNLEKTSELEKRFNNQLVPGRSDDIKSGKELIQGLLDMATQRPARRDFYLREAALEAERTGDIAWAKEIVDKLSTAELRQDVLQWINFNAAVRALREGRLEEADLIAANISDVDQCNFILASIARAYLRSKDKIRATAVLNEGENRALKAKATLESVRALVTLAKVWISLDKERAFEIVEEAIRIANQIDEGSLDEGKITRVLGKDTSEMFVEQVDDASLRTALTGLTSTDFERVLRLSQSIDDVALKCDAIISIAVRDGLEKTLPKPTSSSVR